MKKLLCLSLISGFAFAMLPPAKAPAKGKLPVKEYDEKLQDQFVEAVRRGDYTQVKRMLKFRPRVDVNAPDSGGDRPLEGAVIARNAQIVQLLLENGANPNLRISGGMTPGKTLLMYAVSLGDADIVELLVSYGADLEATYNDTQGTERGKYRKAIDFLSGSGPRYERIQSLLQKTKLR